MSFVGIITNSKNEGYIKDILSKKFPIDNIIFINDRNIDNMKNIRFETILIDKIMVNKEVLKSMISNSRYVILNSDLDLNLQLLEDLDLTIMTYGFNNKSTFSISSVSENNMIIYLQRNMKNIFNEEYESQEFEVKLKENTDVGAVMGAFIILLTYGSKYTYVS